MAALNIAFDAPDNFRPAGPSSTRPIDLVHLARQTMGDKALEIEVLQLFARQARSCLADLTKAAPADIGAIAHRLKGAAANIGAREVAEAAGRLESDPTDAAAVSATAAAIISAENFILKLCR